MTNISELIAGDTSRPIIGITSGKVYNAKHPWAQPVYGQMQTYIEAVLAGGGAPLVLPFVTDPAVIRKYAELVDGMLFAGGNDIEPQRYDQPVTYSEESSRERDQFELELCTHILALDKPLLGICRGMQLLNVARGGTLYQDIAKELPDTHDHRLSQHAEDFAKIAHSIEVDADSQLAQILGVTTLEVNSLHHQAVDRVGDNLTVNAHSSDGIIEGLEDRSRRFVVGVQSHPEALFAADHSPWKNLFEAFVSSVHAPAPVKAKEPA